MHAANSNFTPGRDADVASITTLVRVLETAQAWRDAEAFALLFWPDAVWTTGTGCRLNGLAEISAFARRTLTQDAGDAFASYSIEQITFPEAAIAIVPLHQRQHLGDGSPIAVDPESRPLLILAKRHSLWKIAAGQNTPVREEADAVAVGWAD